MTSALVFVLNSCSALAVPAADPAPATASTATQSPTTLPQPSPLPAPALPPTPMSAVAPSPAATGPQLDCRINSQFPANGTKYEPRASFSVRWDVTNTGTAAWEPGTVDLVYTHGTRMYFSPTIALEHRVAPGDTAALSVGMKALRNTSSYITNWALRRGDTYFCALSLKIFVQWSGGLERYD